jgi:hypothetical protein
MRISASICDGVRLPRAFEDEGDSLVAVERQKLDLMALILGRLPCVFMQTQRRLLHLMIIGNRCDVGPCFQFKQHATVLRCLGPLHALSQVL